MNRSLRSAIYGVSAAAIWGGMYVVSDLVLPVIPPFTLLSIRLTMAVVVLLGVARAGGIAIAIPRRRQIELLGVGLIGFGVSVGAQFVGTDRSTAVNGSLITSASPAFILIFAALLLREKLTLRRIAAVVLATVGVIIIIDLANADFSSDTFFGDIALAVAALTWGLYSVLVRAVSLRAHADTTIVTVYGLIGGLILTLPASAVELSARPIGEITPPVILGILYLGVVSTAAAMWLWSRAFALVDASVASLYFFAQPLVGALLSVILLSQPMTTSLWVGSLLILLGVLLATVQVRRRAATVG
ncbi:MAG: DMT family transporter [Anaerolineae bacterium]|nr:DMT family transporter [Anaerolineae bacterium]NUQ02901.1 EamA family transporter [Anaerolineae bacterium]